jgi:hypothetical protein
MPFKSGLPPVSVQIVFSSKAGYTIDPKNLSRPHKALCRTLVRLLKAVEGSCEKSDKREVSNVNSLSENKTVNHGWQQPIDVSPSTFDFGILKWPSSAV